MMGWDGEGDGIRVVGRWQRGAAAADSNSRASARAFVGYVCWDRVWTRLSRRFGGAGAAADGKWRRWRGRRSCGDAIGSSRVTATRGRALRNHGDGHRDRWDWCSGRLGGGMAGVGAAAEVAVVVGRRWWRPQQRGGSAFRGSSVIVVASRAVVVVGGERHCGEARRGAHK